MSILSNIPPWAWWSLTGVLLLFAFCLWLDSKLKQVDREQEACE